MAIDAKPEYGLGDLLREMARLGEATPILPEVWHLDTCGELWRTRIDASAKEHGFFEIVPPNSDVSEVLLGEASARELRDRLNEYLGDAG